MVIVAVPAGFSFGNPLLLIGILAAIVFIACVVIWLTQPKEKTPEQHYADLAEQGGLK